MKISLAILALLGKIQTIHLDIETSRFLDSQGNPVNLAQTEGHARMILKRVNKYDGPISYQSLVQLECEKAALNQALDDITHCPINQNGPVQAHMNQINLSDNAYVSEFYVGNPPQKLRGLFDTGSTNTWVLNKNVELIDKHGNLVEKEFSFDSESSKTAHMLDQSAAIQFGSGSLKGHFMTDDVRLGTCDEKSSGQIHIVGQKFGNVEKQKTIFTGNNFEAIIGMAYPALAKAGVKPVFDEMMEQKLLKSNIFAFYFTTKQAEEAGLLSDMTFGYYDKDKFKGDITWHPVEFKYMFGVKLDDVKVDGKPMNMCADQEGGCLITFDSGTSLMSFPTWAADKMKEKGYPTSDHVIPCKNKEQFGDLTLVINGKDYTLSNEEWMFPSQDIEMAQGGSQVFNFNMGPLGPQLMAEVDVDLLKPKEEQAVAIETESEAERRKHRRGKGLQHACASTIMHMDIKKSQFLVGDVFMRKYYTIFDRDNDRVGLAEANTDEKLKSKSLAQRKKK